MQSIPVLRARDSLPWRRVCSLLYWWRMDISDALSLLQHQGLSLCRLSGHLSLFTDDKIRFDSTFHSAVEPSGANLPNFESAGSWENNGLRRKRRRRRPAVHDRLCPSRRCGFHCSCATRWPARFRRFDRIRIFSYYLSSEIPSVAELRAIRKEIAAQFDFDWGGSPPAKNQPGLTKF
jgi:hypothetical protein